MTLEDKQLLLRDLCARLPYGVILNCAGDIGEKLKIIDENGLINNDWDIYEVKPYLLPLSSMKEEEMKEMHTMLSPTGTAVYKCDGLSTPVSHFGDFIPYEYMSRVIDWLNAHHFDYRGLIGEGLAISTEVFNPYKD